MAIIYMAMNVVNGKKYIGQTVNTLRSRIRGHINSAMNDGNQCRAFHSAIRKYGKDSFAFTIIEECDISSVNNRESFWISEVGTMTPNGYNLLSGGGNGRKHSKETVELIKKGLTGRIHSKESRIKRGLTNFRRRPIVCVDTGEVFESTGLASDKTGIQREQIRDCLLGKQLTAHSLHWRYADDGDWTPIEYTSKKSVVNVTTGDVYQSRKEAARIIGVNPCMITNAINKGHLCHGFRLRNDNDRLE